MLTLLGNPTCAHPGCHLFIKILSIIGALLTLMPVPLARGQELVVHAYNSSFDDEDGNVQFDADGAKDGVLIWKGAGTVHVIRVMNIPAGRTLRIEPGATVKVAGQFLIKEGKVLWQPPALYSDAFYISEGTGDTPRGTLIMDGIVLTDIRDDSEKGDTNQDGSASLPPLPGTREYENNYLGIDLKGDRHSQSRISKSRLKYTRLKNPGSSTIIEDSLYHFHGIIYNSQGPGFDYGTPHIARNTFEFVTYAGDNLTSWRGSPIIEDNTFRYSPDAQKPDYASYYEPVVTVGGDARGTTIIQNNLFQTGGGIKIKGSGSGSEKFQICGNKFAGGAAVGGKGSCAVTLFTADAVLVTGNTIKDYKYVITFEVAANSPPRLAINANRFLDCERTTSNSPYLDVLWKQNLFINAKDNYWGAPSGPNDPNDNDGFYNPGGKGLLISPGIDYIPFQGGGLPSKDAVKITATSDPAGPLPPAAVVTLTANVEYTLVSVSKGTLFFTVRDKNGYALMEELSVPVTVKAATMTQALQVQVPDFCDIIYLDTVLLPDNGLPLRSNTIAFPVETPEGMFDLIDLRDIDAAAGFFPVAGNRINLKATFRYTCAENGTLEVLPQVRARGSATILASLTAQQQTLAAATDRSESISMGLDIPLWDVLQVPQADLFLKFTLKTGAGAVIDEDVRTCPISSSNTIDIEVFTLKKYASPGQLGRSWFYENEYDAYAYTYTCNIRTAGVSDWQFIGGEDVALDEAENVLHRFTPAAGAVVHYHSTGDGEGKIVAEATTPLPAGTQRLRIYAKLKTSAGVTVACASRDVRVLKPPAQSGQISVPPGASQADFNPIPPRLAFRSNQSAGAAYADEFDYQYTPPGRTRETSRLAKSTAVTANDYAWSFIPINRFWAVYDTLAEGSFTAAISFTYDPARDFPATAGFSEDSLVIAGVNPFSDQLEALPSTLDKSTHTITAEYSSFFGIWVVAARTTTLLTNVNSARRPEMPAGYTLHQNYPNPFNPATMVSYDLPRETHVRLAIYDLLGKEVAVIANDRQLAGAHAILFDGAALASGIYICLMQAGNFMDTKKIVLVK